MVIDEGSPNCERGFGKLAARTTRTYTCAHARVRKRYVNLATVYGDAREPIIYRATGRATVTVP